MTSVKVNNVAKFSVLIPLVVTIRHGGALTSLKTFVRLVFRAAQYPGPPLRSRQPLLVSSLLKSCCFCARAESGALAAPSFPVPAEVAVIPSCRGPGNWETVHRRSQEPRVSPQHRSPAAGRSHVTPGAEAGCGAFGQRRGPGVQHRGWAEPTDLGVSCSKL